MENATERMTVNNEKLERDPVKTVILASMNFLIFMHTGRLRQPIFLRYSFPR